MRFTIAAVAASLLPTALFAQGAANAFNPNISLIVDAGLAVYSNEEDYEIAGFPLSGEAGVAEEGFALNEVELVASADIDGRFYGQVTLGAHQDEGATEIDIEEAFMQTVGLANGFTVKAGKFFSELGYLNTHHKHAWDFADAPLAYRAMLGRQYSDTGVQLRWVAPTETLLELGMEWTRGDGFPAGGSGQDGRGAGVVFAHLGGDIGRSHSWQLGASHLRADNVVAELGGHSHDGGGAADNEFIGSTKLSAIDWVYKWSPNGNTKHRSLKVQGEMFWRDMNGEFEYSEGADSGEGSLDTEQQGWYLQAVYQFMPRWRVGVRYDELKSDTQQVADVASLSGAFVGADDDLYEASGWADEGVSPQRSTVMVDYSNSEFSRFRLQYSTEESRHPGEEKDEQIFVQYVFSIGAHGAHRF